MWFQIGEPQTDGFVKYYSTGWQRAVLPPPDSDVRPPPWGCGAQVPGTVKWAVSALLGATLLIPLLTTIATVPTTAAPRRTAALACLHQPNQEA